MCHYRMTFVFHINGGLKARNSGRQTKICLVNSGLKTRKCHVNSGLKTRICHVRSGLKTRI